MCMSIPIAALFTIAKIQKQPNCLTVHEQIKRWYLYTMEYYSATKANEILQFAMIWMHLEGIMLSEICQRKINSIVFHLHVNSKKQNI